MVVVASAPLAPLAAPCAAHSSHGAIGGHRGQPGRRRLHLPNPRHVTVLCTTHLRAHSCFRRSWSRLGRTKGSLGQSLPSCAPRTGPLSRAATWYAPRLPLLPRTGTPKKRKRDPREGPDATARKHPEQLVMGRKVLAFPFQPHSGILHSHP